MKTLQEKIVLCCCLLFSIFSTQAIHAKKATKDYQRPSLHMVLLTTDEPTAPEKYMGYVSESWQNYTLPTMFNDFKIPFTEAKAGNPKGSMMQLITEYGSRLNSLSIDELKELSENLSGKQYNEELKKYADGLSNEIAHQLIAKWWGLTEDGNWSDELIFKLACYSATQNQANAAAQTNIGAQRELYNELTEPTMANTYVSFSKLNFYQNEPIAKFAKDIAVTLAGLTAAAAGPMGAAALAAAEKAADEVYNKTKDGFSAYTTTLLYKLKWDEDEATKFWACFDGNKINWQKFNATPFELEYLGTNKCNTIVLANKDKADAKAMVEKTMHKNLYKQLILLQNNYEEFKPMMPIMDVYDKVMIADMGTKESITEKDVFDVYEPEVNENGILKYKKVGVTKPIKGGIWDNEDVDNTVNADNNDNELQGTQFKAVKNANNSMLLKKQKAKK
ncbi:MAG: hypothetical protein K2I68_00850 [Bacteroidales bacterium]|nr:hypothetical protein [Bacteroidales bacterium]